MDASLRLIDERKDDAMVLFWFSVLDSFWGENPGQFFFISAGLSNSKLLDTWE
jgi:hypothetical protein